MDNFSEEYQKYLYEKNNLEIVLNLELSKDKTNMNPKKIKDLFNIRQKLKLYVFDICMYKGKNIIILKFSEKFLKDYHEFLKEKRDPFPNFIFDDFNSEYFDRCVDYYFKQNHSLIETDNYYINNFKKDKNKH